MYVALRELSHIVSHFLFLVFFLLIVQTHENFIRLVGCVWPETKVIR